MVYVRFLVFMIGTIIFSFGIAVTINMQHLGLHPWDVLNVGLYDKFGMTIGTWNIIIGIILVTVSLILDRTYVRIGTVLNAILVGSFVDFYLWLDILPKASHTWIDIVVIVCGIIIMGVGGGIYNGAGIGSGPRDGFMLSISDKTSVSIGKVRIMTETSILLLGLFIGGPVFIFTFIFTFVQSPIFQFVYMKIAQSLNQLESKKKEQTSRAM